MEKYSKKILLSAFLFLLAVVIALPVADFASNPAVLSRLTASLDAKVETVLKLTSSSTVASVGISAIPGDTATPIAQKLADLSFYFLLILCVLYTEKYMLGILGLAVFRVMIPCACLLWILSLFRKSRACRALAVKLLVLGLVLYIAIPVSIGLSDKIYAGYEASIAATVEQAEELTEKTSQLTQAGEDRGLLQSVLSTLSESASSLSNRAAQILSRYVETIAVMVVTSCVIPIAALAFILWIVKYMTGADAFGKLLASPERK